MSSLSQNARSAGAHGQRPALRCGRRWLFIAAALLLVTAAIELGSAIAWSVATGEMFSWSAAQRARDEARAGSSAAAGPGAAQIANGGIAVHPFLGFVDDASAGPRRGFTFSRWGFVGEQSPVRAKSDDTWVVGVTGGSVAMMLCLFGGDALCNALARSPALAGRRIELVPLGCGGYKQPQQLFTVQMLLLLGGHFDCIVALDGFNEVALVEENVPLGVPAWYPRSWARLLDSVPTVEQQRRLGLSVLLREQRDDLVATADALWWSPTAQFVWRWRDRALASRLAALREEIERAPAAPSFAVTGPGNEGRTVDEARAHMVDVWQRASRDLHALCQRHGIAYCHVLQPNQYVPGSKPIGEHEARVALQPDHAYARGVAAGYPLLQRAGEQLRADGVPFADLTGIFREHPEPLYEDTCCHVNRPGNVILAEHVAAAVRAQLEPGLADLRSLRVAPALRLASPLAVQRVAVIGVDTGGREHDVAGEALGTRLIAPSGDRFAIAVDGAVRALRRGPSSLSVVHGSLSADVAVTADWPDLFDGDDAKSAAAGERPALRVVGGVDGDTTAVALQCTGLPAGGVRLLVAADRPLPVEPQPPGQEQGIHTMPLDAAAAVSTASVPLPVPSGLPLFLRVFVLGEGATIVAASNTLVITRG